MRLTPSQLPAALKQRLLPVYLVAGEELLLMQEALDAIRACARAQGYLEREVLDVERGFDWQRLIDSCNSMSLFAEKRIVEVRSSGAIDAAGGAALSTLTKNPASDVLLIVSAGKIEWRARSGGWFAALENAGASLYIERQKPQDLPGWIEARLRSVGLAADADAVRRLAQLTEGNLLATAQEISKLALLYPPSATAQARVGLEQVEAAVADSAHYEVYDWINKVLAGDAAGAVRGLERLRDEGVEVPAILGALVFDLRKLIVAAVIYARSHNAEAAVESAGVFKQRQGVFARAAARIKPAQARDALRLCARVDQLYKSTGMAAAAWEELLTWALGASGAAAAAAATAGKRSMATAGL
ncbi:MAG: polymerase subunit delta [Nevskia sp.]|nr:polymerase subunit delta [Nevskia sp.]